MKKESRPINWRDSFSLSQDRTVLTERELRVPGLRTLGWHNMKKAIPALEPHFHENAIEITFVLKGEIKLLSNNKLSTTCGGNAYLVQANTVHSTAHLPMNIGEICWLQLDISDRDNFLFLRHDASETLINALSAIGSDTIITDNRQCTAIIKKLLRDTVKQPRNVCHPLHTAALLIAFLDTLLEFVHHPRPRITPEIERVCTFIQKHIQGNFSLEELSLLSGLSLPQFKNKFNRQIGISPRRYINQKKVEAVKALLFKGDSITDLAQKFGFCDSSYFAAVFKKHTGITPTEYAREQKERIDEDSPPVKRRKTMRGNRKASSATVIRRGKKADFPTVSQPR